MKKFTVVTRSPEGDSGATEVLGDSFHVNDGGFLYIMSNVVGVDGLADIEMVAVFVPACWCNLVAKTHDADIKELPYKIQMK